MNRATSRRVPLVRTMAAGGLVALTVASWWLGLRYVVAHTTGSRPDHLVADIIVPLAGSSERDAYAHTLWSRRIAPALGSTLFDTECLRRRGFDSACATGVRNTVDEAVVLRRLFQEARVARAIVVTSPYHLARATAIFAVMFVGTGIDVHVVATPHASAASHALAKEVKSYLPSLGAAVLARLFPPAYEWSMRSLRTLRSWRYAWSAGS